MRILALWAWLFGQLLLSQANGANQESDQESDLDEIVAPQIARITWGPSTNGLKAGLDEDRLSSTPKIGSWVVWSYVLNLTTQTVANVRRPPSQFGAGVTLRDDQHVTVPKSWYGRWYFPRENLLFSRSELQRIWRRLEPRLPKSIPSRFPWSAYSLEPIHLFRVPKPGRYTLRAELMVLINGKGVVLPPVEYGVQISSEDLAISQFREPFENDWANVAVIVGSVGLSVVLLRFVARRLKKLAEVTDSPRSSPPPGISFRDRDIGG